MTNYTNLVGDMDGKAWMAFQTLFVVILLIVATRCFGRFCAFLFGLPCTS